MPAKQVKIASLGKQASYAGGAIRSVHLLGNNEALTWTQREDELVVVLPPSLPTAHASALKIELATVQESER